MCWRLPGGRSPAVAMQSVLLNSGRPGCARCCAIACWINSPPRRFWPRGVRSRRTSVIPIRFSMSGSNPKINHLGIAVKSIDQALHFYRDQLGLTVSLRETVAIEKVHAALLPVGESRIELLEATGP